MFRDGFWSNRTNLVPEKLSKISEVWNSLLVSPDSPHPETVTKYSVTEWLGNLSFPFSLPQSSQFPYGSRSACYSWAARLPQSTVCRAECLRGGGDDGQGLLSISCQSAEELLLLLFPPDVIMSATLPLQNASGIPSRSGGWKQTSSLMSGKGRT